MADVNTTLSELELEQKNQEKKALEELQKQKDELEKQKNALFNEAKTIADNQPVDSNLSEDELQALGDNLAGKEVVNKTMDLEEQKKAMEKRMAEVNEKVENTSKLTIDDVKKEMRESYEKQLKIIEQQAKEKEEAYNKKLEEIKMNQMSEKEKEEYRKIQRMKEEAEKMDTMASLVDQLKRERAEQDKNLQEMKKKAKDIAFIRSSLQTEPWMADLVQSLEISTEEEYKRFSKISGNIKKWKKLEEYDNSKGNKNVFGEVIGGTMSAQTQQKADEIGAEVKEMLASVIRK